MWSIMPNIFNLLENFVDIIDNKIWSDYRAKIS